MNFITLDFETANSERSSPCEIGLVVVENNKIVDRISYLIRPQYNEFDWYNTEIHGIDEKMVEKEPEFDVIFPKIKPLLEKYPIIAHFAAFDMSVLRSTLDLYGITYPTFNYSCSYQMSKRSFPGLFSYRLDSLCDEFGIELNHHRALPDAIATAELVNKILKEKGIDHFENIENILKIRLGKFYPGGYTSSLQSKLKISEIEFDDSNADTDHQFYGKTFCFTGALESMKRADAQKLVLEMGANCSSGVNKQTKILIVGEQDYSQYGEGFISKKMQKAYDYLKAGQDIELITESQFLEML